MFKRDSPGSFRLLSNFLSSVTGHFCLRLLAKLPACDGCTDRRSSKLYASLLFACLTACLSCERSVESVDPKSRARGAAKRVAAQPVLCSHWYSQPSILVKANRTTDGTVFRTRSYVSIFKAAPAQSDTWTEMKMSGLHLTASPVPTTSHPTRHVVARFSHQYPCPRYIGPIMRHN
ncbi:uncharacterized protein BKA78DRAFT_78275 [Phyllosticta capitalensis]|uniref:uncharacterized protein n=1 Tax=Phyllosticta capitalensis TaxID=121624 RepID=UPI0031323B2C